MVERVEAFTDSEGNLHKTATAAALADLDRWALAWWQRHSIPSGSKEFVLWLRTHGQDLHAVLDPVVQAAKGPVMRDREREGDR